MNGALRGYSRQEIEALRDVINNIARESGEKIVLKLHDEIIVPMSTAWYAPEAIEFFEGFAETVKISGEEITEAFDIFRNAVQEAGTNWAENTKGETPVLPNIDTVDTTISIAEIQPDNGGKVTLDTERARSIADGLSEVEQAIKADLEALAENLDAETSFIGGGQGAAVQECFVKVSGAVHKIFKYLTEGDNNLYLCLKLFAKKYEDVAEGIASAFNNTNVN